MLAGRSPRLSIRSEPALSLQPGRRVPCALRGGICCRHARTSRNAQLGSRPRNIVRCSIAGGGSPVSAVAPVSFEDKLGAALPFGLHLQPSLISPDIRYTLCGKMFERSGKETYVELMNHWQQRVPTALGSNFKLNVRHSVKTDPRTVVVRWTASWVSFDEAKLQQADALLNILTGIELEAIPSSAPVQKEMNNLVPETPELIEQRAAGLIVLSEEQLKSLQGKLVSAEASLMEASKSLGRDVSSGGWAPSSLDYPSTAVDSALKLVQESLAAARALHQAPGTPGVSGSPGSPGAPGTLGVTADPQPRVQKPPPPAPPAIALPPLPQAQPPVTVSVTAASSSGVGNLSRNSSGINSISSSVGGSGVGAMDVGGSVTVPSSLVALEKAKLRQSLTCSARGTSTIRLDSDGRIISHEDSVDFHWSNGADVTPDAAAAITGGDASNFKHADSAWLLCCAFAPPGETMLAWQATVARQMLWETYAKSEYGTEMGEESSLTQEEFNALFDSAVLGFLVQMVFLIGFLIYFPYWLVVVAPTLQGQVDEMLFIAGYADTAPAMVDAPVAAIADSVVAAASSGGGAGASGTSAAAAAVAGAGVGGGGSFWGGWNGASDSLVAGGAAGAEAGGGGVAAEALIGQGGVVPDAALPVWKILLQGWVVDAFSHTNAILGEWS